jgi:hypothetical protein
VIVGVWPNPPLTVGSDPCDELVLCDDDGETESELADGDGEPVDDALLDSGSSPHAVTPIRATTDVARAATARPVRIDTELLEAGKAYTKYISPFARLPG